MTTLFSPGKIGAIDVANRTVMAPLTRARADMEGIPSPYAAQYYAQRATAGLIITEATNISAQARGYAYTPGIYTDAQLTAWRKVTEAVHEADGKIVLQLWHTGRISHSSLHGGESPVAPSAIQADDMVFTEDGAARPSMPRALHIEEISPIIEDYVLAAHHAKAAGFDGVEVHAANAYLLDQFIRDSTNKRTDAYGGPVENRTRLAFEVAQAVSEVWGANRVGIRLSPITRVVGDTPLDSDPAGTYFRMAERLGTLGLAYLHCVEGQTQGENAASSFDFQALRGAFGGSYIANNSYDRELALDAISHDHADMVAFGRPYISNPDLVERLRHGSALAPGDEKTYYGGGATGYVDYPTQGGVSRAG